MLYYLFIVFCMIVVAVLNILFFDAGALTIILAVVIATVGVMVIDGISAFIVRWLLPKKWFGIDKNFGASKKTSRFYEKIGVKKWKDKIPELGGFTDFHKNKIKDPKDNKFVSRYIEEANYGVVIHFAGIVLGFALMLVYLPFALNIALPIAVVNAVYNYLSFVILRYNLPKLHVLYKYNERKEKEK